jgi:hypothetical protein
VLDDDLREADRRVSGGLGEEESRFGGGAQVEWVELASPGLPSGLRRFGLRFDDVHSPRRWR